MKKKFYQKKWFIILMAILVIGIIGGALGGDETPPEPENNSTAEQQSNQSEDNLEQSTTEPQATENAESLSVETFIEDVKEVIQGSIGQDESIPDVSLDNGDLSVYVDFSQADPSPLTLEDLALSRTSSITDSILELTHKNRTAGSNPIFIGTSGTYPAGARQWAHQRAGGGKPHRHTDGTNDGSGERKHE